MATRTAVGYARTARSRSLNAQCDANQPLVNVIAEKRERMAQSNYSYTLKRAMESLCKAKEPITSYDQALQLPGIGPGIASMLFEKAVARPKKKKNPPAAGGASKGRKRTQANEENDTNDVVSVASSAATSLQSTSKRPRKQQLQNLLAAKEAPSVKEAAYQKAVREAEAWKGKNLTWRLVLLIDGRERKAEHYSSKVQQCGIPTEIRTLPIGDMTWIAQGSGRSAKGDEKVQAELLLGTIIERKEVNDLKSSLFGTRYNEQQLRLKSSGQPQVIFLVEGDITKDQYKCPAETLHSTLYAIRFEKGNQVVQTAHMEETVKTLRRMHRRMLKRTFPTAFYRESLPTFAGPEAGGSRQGRKRDSFGEQRRRRRRRLESLHGLTFDEEPVPMAGMDRFTTYKELCAKIERDRESGRRTVGGIHQAMLKQVASISDTKIPSICELYPTVTSLLKAYDDAGPEHGKALLQSVALQNPGAGEKTAAAGNRTLGARSAAELHIAYGLDEDADSGNEAEEENDSPKYAELVRTALESQERAATAQTMETLNEENETALHESSASTASTVARPAQPRRATATATVCLVESDDGDDDLQQAITASLSDGQKSSPACATATHEDGADRKRNANSTSKTSKAVSAARQSASAAVAKAPPVSLDMSDTSDDDDDLLNASFGRSCMPRKRQQEVIELD